MKRTLSLILSAVLVFASCSLLASAAQNDLSKIYYVRLPAEDDTYTITVADGYDVFVTEGGNFVFSVQAKSGYSIKSAIVSVDGNPIFKTDNIDEYFPGHTDIQVYVIEGVYWDIDISVTNVLKENQASLFEWLIKLINSIVEFFARLFG